MMNMKMKKYIFTTLIAATAIFFSGCVEETEQYTIKHFGDEIVFGGRASYGLNEKKKAKATRTVYTGDFLNKDGETWKEGDGTKYEVIKWINGDKVRIYSPQAAGIKPADYSVALTGESTSQTVALNKIGDGALQWSDEKNYDFYAVYPSPHQYPLNDKKLDEVYNKEVLNGANEEECTIITGKIPSVQSCTGKPTNTSGNWTLAPNMQYAYMVARQSVTNADKTASEIYLNFVPIATAVEIELKNISEKELKLTNILISSANNNTIFGEFTANLAELEEGTKTNNQTSYTVIPEDFVSLTGGASGNQISIPTYDGNEGLIGNPITLANGNSIKFTIFMLPTEDIEDLKITLIGIEGNRVGTTNGINIAKHKKTYLQKMPINRKQGEYNQSKWVTYLPDNAYIQGLSIPGAGGATSGHITSNRDETYLEQTLTIEKLWKQGIRCFEFTVDKHSTDNGDIGTCKVYCNSKETGVTLADAVKNVKDQLCANPSEFAMVIVTYQQSTGWDKRETDGSVNNTRKPAIFMSQFNTFWNKVSEGTDETVGTWKTPSGVTLPEGVTLGTELYTTDMTIFDARGKLFCIARPTSEGEDNFWKINNNSTTKSNITSTTRDALPTPSITNDHILMINGWGPLKDKWEARGFTACGYKRGVGNTAYTGYNKGYLGGQDNKPGRPFDTSNCKNVGFDTTLPTGDSYGATTNDLGLEANFHYDTNSSTEKGKAWVQEWARVCDETKTFELDQCSGLGHPTHLFGSGGQYLHWLGSITEKENHIKQCLDYALAQKINGEDAKDVVFINSLCGYYINATTSNKESALPNSLTDINLANNQYSQLTGASSTAGMCGNIQGFATYINDYFYKLLQDVTTNPTFVAGPMGIILMDRISEDKTNAGNQIPSIIIANNFQHVLPSAPVTKLAIPRDPDGYNEENGDKFAAPAKRNATNEGIVWE